MRCPRHFQATAFRPLRWTSCLLPGMLIIFLVTAASATLPPDAEEFVIVTSAELAPEFESLATFKTDIGMRARVVTLDWIAAHVEPGVDLAETIRRFLQEAHVQWGTQYVLLGGDLEVIPTRWVYNTYYPTIGGTDLPVDLYYAGLDGDWDGDGDGIYGEPYGGTEDPGDDADLVPELGLGRAPVSTSDEAALFVQKSIAFHMQSGSITLPRALLSADVLFPETWPDDPYLTMDGADFAEDLRIQLEAADLPWLVDRHYENCTRFPGSICGTADTVYEAMAAGEYRLVHHIAFTSFARGDSLIVGPDLIAGDDLASLENPIVFFLTTTVAEGAAHDISSPLVRTLLAQNGGCAAGLGSSRVAFSTTIAKYNSTFYEFALAEQGVCVGDALRSTFGSFSSYTWENRADRWTCMTLLLLGDPTLPLSAVELPVSIDDRETVQNENEDELPTPGLQAYLTAAPNPFNPQVEIRGELPVAGNVRVGVCDVRGREVCILFNGLCNAGEATWDWNGRDRTGRDVASGVYLIRMETESHIVHRAVTLMR
ncbi:MAG: hypothetical protein KOO60_14410 [Gemmatimonadales bacterium]|nr:hypothetical protein [Gemmatimonadales bacterium]